MPEIALVLFDLDGVLVAYDHRGRIAHLGKAIGRSAEAVHAALFESGLESRYDAGLLTTDEYLAQLGTELGASVDRAAWTAARAAAMACTDATCARIAALSAHRDVAVLSNNGELVAGMLPDALPQLFPALHGRVFCSGTIGASKPDAAAFLHVLDRLGHLPQRSLFLDDRQQNVDGARAAGLNAERILAPGDFDHVLRDYGLA